MSDKELKRQLPIFMLLFNDKKVLKDYLRFFGCEKKYYKKLGIEFKQKQKVDNKWF